MTNRPDIRRYLTPLPTSTDALQAETSSAGAKSIVSTSTKPPTPRRKRVVESDSDVDSTPSAKSTIAYKSPITTTTATTTHAPEVCDISSDGLQDDEIWVRPAKTLQGTATANATSGIGVPQGD
jgi:hypothetical protein